MRCPCLRRVARGVDPRPLTPVRGSSHSSAPVDGRRPLCSLPGRAAAPPSLREAAPPSPHQAALQSARSGLTSVAGSVAVPELSPLLQRVTEILSEVERQRDQLSAQGHILEEYRSQTDRWRALSSHQPAAPQVSGQSEAASVDGLMENGQAAVIFRKRNYRFELPLIDVVECDLVMNEFPWVEEDDKKIFKHILGNYQRTQSELILI